ncbi:hypothetical protein ABZW30_38540 [Kitasatospora sp. NPDC004669]|uniref:hypothetical protein n=1 Tax=Kitasatospora sp. NPDC004669 TaxID=3154555 RepID=UPI00339F8D19
MATTETAQQAGRYGREKMESTRRASPAVSRLRRALRHCGQIPKQENTYEYGLHRQWTRRPQSRCYPCHHKHEERQEKAGAKAFKCPERAREAKAVLDLPGLGGRAGAPLELDEKAGPDRLECRSA